MLHGRREHGEAEGATDDRGTGAGRGLQDQGRPTQDGGEAAVGPGCVAKSTAPKGQQELHPHQRDRGQFPEQGGLGWGWGASPAGFPGQASLPTEGQQLS